MHVDTTGKVSLDHIYTQSDPRAYFTTLRELEYCIPQVAKPYFQDQIQEYREARQVRTPKILDIGCSYGINAALLKCDATMDELYERYCDPAVDTTGALLARDREFTHSRGRPEDACFVGLDTSDPALSYGLKAGFLDHAVHADLEANDPTERQRALFAGADLVISTGCLGYVTDKTIMRIVDAQSERKPWMAHFVLRMFPFDPVEESLATAGYETVRLDRLFKQRVFATLEEQSLVLEALSDVGVDPQGLETDGWLYAQLHISRPRNTKD